MKCKQKQTHGWIASIDFTEASYRASALNEFDNDEII